MTGALAQFKALVGRELRTVARTRVYALLAVGLAGLVVALVAGGGGGQTGYLPAVVDLLLPLELVVPLAAVAVGYRSVVDDLERGELAVLETYDVSPWVYVLAVYVGRAALLAAVLTASLLVSGLVIALASAPDTTVYATHSGVDSPILWGRFLVLTVLFGLVMEALVVLLSVAARSVRAAVVLATGGVLLAAAGGDALIVVGLADGWLAESNLLSALAATPNSAYRGVVFETVIGVAAAGESGYAAPLPSVLGLFGWLVGSLAAATLLLSRRHL
ncbi:ABC transporter permease [Halohasta salina]|uniref:ABC transporter permease n=1 Tax=Halohasta salina TaxID=2961621 RepID=UPI0020A3F26E|nr:ABC transporter permease subunit [Halohasta salina]